MTEEEKQLNINSSSEKVETSEEVNTLNVETPDENSDSEIIPGVAHRTETISSGPYTDEIRVIKREDLEKSGKPDKDKTEIYESSLKDIALDQRVTGTIVSIQDNGILMDVGFKSEGIVSRDEFEEGELPKIGDQIEVFVDILEDENGQMILSKRKADFMRVWERIREIYENSETVEGRVLNRIKGGMVVDVMGIDAFLPGSQIDVQPVIDFDSYIGKTYEFRIVKLNELRKNVVLSRKELLEEDLKEKREDLLSKVKVGDVLKGRVKNITDFGVFVDLGGLDGLLHITDLSWGRVNHPKEVVKMNEEITVKVIDYDPIKQRVSLGLKQLTPHPWEGIEEKYQVGSTIKGKVVNITNYGVFIELEKGIEGLIHISEVSWTQHIRHPSEVFSLGQEVEAKVLGIDIEERKIALGYKQLQPDPWETIEQTYPPDSVHKGIVRNITSYGAFIQLQEGIDGFVHISDLLWSRKIRNPREVLRKGEEVEVKILGVSKENRKINVGIKQLSEDPWPLFEDTYSEGSIIEGEISKITDKVVFVRLDSNLEGMVPINQFPKDDRDKLSKKINVGDKLKFKIIEINKDDMKIVLSRSEALPQKPKSEVEAYMMSQEELANKIEIPEEVVEKVTESEKEAEKKTKIKPAIGPDKSEQEKKPEKGKKEVKSKEKAEPKKRTRKEKTEEEELKTKAESKKKTTRKRTTKSAKVSPEDKEKNKAKKKSTKKDITTEEN